MSLTFTEAGCAIALSRLSFLGPVRLRALRNHTTSWEETLLHAGDIAQRLGWPNAHKIILKTQRHSLHEQAKRDAATCEKENIITLMDTDTAYPALLHHIDDPPAFLHMRGMADGKQPALAVVGTRTASQYGMHCGKTLAGDLVVEGCVVVSGLALGIDTAAHEGARDAGGISWAFPGSGLTQSSLYPANNQPLAEKIVADGGALFSEFPPDMRGFRHLFPMRNRLIAGATIGTVVVEAHEKSGALMTAHAALGYNRLVFAVPGDITRPQSVGPNRLIRAGAIPITGKQDILEALDIPTVDATPAPRAELSQQEHTLLHLLARADCDRDDLTRESSIAASHVAACVSHLELLGLIRCNGGQWHLTDRGILHTRP